MRVVTSAVNNLDLCLIPLISTQRHEPTRKLPWCFSIGRIIWHLASFLPTSFHSALLWKSPPEWLWKEHNCVVKNWIRKKQWVKPLSHLSYLLPGGGATETAAGASERSLHCHDFPAHTVSDPEHKGPQRPVSIPGVVICVFSHKVNHLAHVVFNIISIISFKTCYH